MAAVSIFERVRGKEQGRFLHPHLDEHYRLISVKVKPTQGEFDQKV
jgi:hypothetical protein